MQQGEKNVPTEDMTLSWDTDDRCKNFKNGSDPIKTRFLTSFLVSLLVGQTLL